MLLFGVWPLDKLSNSFHFTLQSVMCHGLVALLIWNMINGWIISCSPVASHSTTAKNPASLKNVKTTFSSYNNIFLAEKLRRSAHIFCHYVGYLLRICSPFFKGRTVKLYMTFTQRPNKDTVVLGEWKTTPIWQFNIHKCCFEIFTTQ